jgi:hypothetical protein
MNKKIRTGEREQTRRDKTLIISVSLQFCLSFFLFRWIGGSNGVESGAERATLWRASVVLGIRVAMLTIVVLATRFLVYWVKIVDKCMLLSTAGCGF